MGGLYQMIMCLFFTTNYKDNFDSALFRLGRISIALEITPMIDMTMWDTLIFNIYELDENKWKTFFTEKELDQICKLKLTIAQVNMDLVLPNLYNWDNFMTALKHLCSNI